MSLLNRWPDSRIALRGCINVPLSREMRKVAWLACLSDNETVKDFFDYINTDRIQKNSAIVGSTLFHICQSCLGNHQPLVSLSSQYRVVKRMEQVLGYLLHEKSIPHLRAAKLDIAPLPPDELSQRHAPTRSHPELAQLQLYEDDGNLRRRQMLLMVPFLKALELDDADTMSYGSAQEVRMKKTKFYDEDGEFIRVVARSAEPETKDWLNVFYANEAVTKRKRGGFNADLDEARTARLAEVYSRFWSIIPYNWREEGDLMVQSVSSDVETHIHNEDRELYSFLSVILNQCSDTNGFSNFRKLVKQMFGDAFVGKCSLNVLCYIYDQLIMASFESTGDEHFPPMDSICAWICGSMIIIMRDKILKCTSIQELNQIVALNQSSLTVKLLSTTVEVHFLSKFRKSLLKTYTMPPPFVDLPDHVFGYDAAALSVARIETHDVREKVSLYLTNAKRIAEGKFAIGGKEDASTAIGEQDLVFAETEEYVLLKEFYVEKKRKERRLRQLMRKWKSFSRSLGYWALYFSVVKKKVDIRNQKKAERAKLEAERLRQKQLEEELARQRAEREAYGTSLLNRLVDGTRDDDHIFGVWGSEDEYGEDGMDANLHSANTYGIDNDPLLAEEIRLIALRKAEEEAAELERLRLKNLVIKPKQIFNSIVVLSGTYTGDELLKLSSFGKIVQQLFLKIEYVLNGHYTLNAAAVRLIAHCLSFESKLAKDTSAVVKRSPTEPFLEMIKSVPAKKRGQVIKQIEKTRNKALKESLKNYKKGVTEDIIMITEEDTSAGDSFKEKAVDIVARKALIRQEKSLYRFTSLFLNVVEKLKSVIDGEQEFRETNWLASVKREAEFRRAEKIAWKSVYGDSGDFTDEKFKNALNDPGKTSQRDAFFAFVENYLRNYSATQQAFWQHQEIKLDLSEKYVKSLSLSTHSILRGIGLNCVENMETSISEDIIEKLDIAANFAGTHFEFQFSIRLGKNQPRLELGLITYKSFINSTIYRELEVRSEPVLRDELELLEYEEVLYQCHGVMNVSSNRGILGRMTITNIRTAWHATETAAASGSEQRRALRVSIPHMQLARVAPQSSKYGLALCLETFNGVRVGFTFAQTEALDAENSRRRSALVHQMARRILDACKVFHETPIFGVQFENTPPHHISSVGDSVVNSESNMTLFDECGQADDDAARLHEMSEHEEDDSNSLEIIFDPDLGMAVARPAGSQLTAKDVWSKFG
ncbi:Bardet-Biedl syndrome 5 protein [Entophlyctis sp. JEL0112]|nr:Bardet-Biedl syndrome 5 protein [Entophlyctis sp. JEL0112]